ncbi:MAG TPA: hypothetical protein VHU19_11430 [Pyrinomonadaceae bacterium]|jgi:hypothetical protein|nr:hypothetical protein [Pyrinomonadaceae bacterium]
MAELFDRFEINRVPRWPLLSRLLALSVVLHGLFIVTVAYVPTLRSLLYVAGTVSGFKLVSEDYDPTLIGQRATIVRFAPHEKLYYPPDYFGAPEVAETSPFDPTFVQQAAPPPPVVYRQPRRAYTPRALPTPQPSPSPEVAKASATPTPAASPTPDEAQKKAEEELDRIAKENGVERPPVINTQPFEDVALKGKELIDQGKLDLKNNTLDVTATAERNDDGTLKPETVHINWNTASDENTNALAQQLITAFSQSKVLSMLKGAKGVNLALKLDQQNISFKIASELPSDNDANNYATTYALMLGIARNSKKGTNEGELYNNLKVVNDGKQLVLIFEMPKEAAGKMITDMLAKKAAKDKEAAAQNKS